MILLRQVSFLKGRAPARVIATMNILRLTLISLGSLVCSLTAGEPTTLVLADNGRALQNIVVAPGASERTRIAAAELADYLGRITGAKFKVQQGDGTTGLAVGPATDFPVLKLDGLLKNRDPFRCDDYLLRTHGHGAFLVGASDVAAHLAVWDFLHRLGYRLYFLTDTWEIIPKSPAAKVALDEVERPHYFTRAAPRGAENVDRALQVRWELRNRITSSFTLLTGHAYARIIAANEQAFAAHPEFYALVNGGRNPGDPNTTKVCVSNPDLRKLFVDYAVKTMRASSGDQSISMDPSDGGNWCECEHCLGIGSVTDRAVTLANDVATAINQLGLGPKYVGIYAYNQHSPPPTIRVHPQVVVSVATSFIRGGFTVEKLVEGWQSQGATIGIREYHDVFTWSRDLPRRARGGDLPYLAKTIPYFFQHGARFMNSENADSWGANGLGDWITPRLRWTTTVAADVETLVDDFLNHAFPGVQAPMRDFYHLLNRDKSIRSMQDVVARMYRSLQAAFRATADEKVRARLDDLVLYTRYVELYSQYELLGGAARQAKFEAIWRHAYRMRSRHLLSTESICQNTTSQGFRDAAVKVPSKALWTVPEGKNPWKNSASYSAGEIESILLAGIAANQPTVLDFQPVEFSKDLIPAHALALPPVAPGKCSQQTRGTARAYTWLSVARQPFTITVTGGLIPQYRDRGNVAFRLFSEQEATLEPVAQDTSVPPDGVPRRVTFTSPYLGLHWLEWTDGHDRTQVSPAETLPWTFCETADNTMSLQGSWSLYFYVPRGTRVIGGFATNRGGWVLNPQGKRVFSFDELPGSGHFSVPVPDGEDGALWKMEEVSGARLLMTVPPCFAKTVEALLLPKEVVEADARGSKQK